MADPLTKKTFTFTSGGDVVMFRFTFQALRIVKKRLSRSPRDILTKTVKMRVYGTEMDIPAVDEDDVCELLAAGAQEFDRTITSDRVAMLLERNPTQYTELMVAVVSALGEAYRRMNPSLGEEVVDDEQSKQPSTSTQSSGSPTASSPTAKPGTSGVTSTTTAGQTSDD